MIPAHDFQTRQAQAQGAQPTPTRFSGAKTASQLTPLEMARKRANMESLGWLGMDVNIGMFGNGLYTNYYLGLAIPLGLGLH